MPLPNVNNGESGASARAKINAGLNSIRELLTADRTYYVRADGSDSNTGLVNNAGGAWLTLQHAMDFISSSLDFAYFKITVSIGAGSFVGMGVKSTVGGGILYFEGAGSGSTTITDGPADGIFNYGQCISALVVGVSCLFGINKVNLASTSYSCADILVPGIYFFFGDPANPLSGGDMIFSGASLFIDTFGQNFVQTVTGSFTIDASLSSPQQSFWYIQSGSQVYDDATWTITGTLAISGGTTPGFVVLGDTGTGGFYTQNVSTYTGTVTGPKYGAVGGSGISHNTSARLPGSTEGSLDCVSYIIDENGATNVFIVSALPIPAKAGARAFVTDSNATLAAGLGNIVATGSSNKVPVYSDGTNWRIG